LRACDVDAQPIAIALDRHGPRPAADRAILDERASRVGIDIEIDPLAAVRATNADRALLDAGNRAASEEPVAQVADRALDLALVLGSTTNRRTQQTRGRADTHSRHDRTEHTRRPGST
jgi:hypothetical protein